MNKLVIGLMAVSLVFHAMAGPEAAQAASVFVDNGNGTITDVNTGLMWEKKRKRTSSPVVCTNTSGSCADPHDADNQYTWTDGPCCAETDYDGTAVTIFLEQLNNRCSNDPSVSCTVDANCAVPGGACGFAGHRDWRLPTQTELLGIVVSGAAPPAVASAFRGANCGAACTDLANPACSCDALSGYWSSVGDAGVATDAWYVNTNGGGMLSGLKTGLNFVRAVRGGS